ncbi:hypothetical protein AB0J42_17260 [Nonomuraea sp. NPDC049649]
MPREGADCFDEGGRGLLIVDSVAKSWGWRRPGSVGKIVWCQLSAV